MRLFMRLIAAFIILIVVILLPLTLFAYQVGHILFSPQSMLNLVAEQIVGPSQSNLVTQTFLQSLPAELGIAEDSVVGKALANAAQRTDINSSLLPSDLQLIYAAQGINAFYDWLGSSDPMPVVRLDMAPFKAHLQDNTVELVGTILEGVPVCNGLESLSLATELLNAVLSGQAILDALPACLPEIIPLDSITPAIGGLLNEQINLIPQTIVLDNLFTASPEAMLKLKERLHLAQGIMLWSWLPFVFLLLIASFIGGQTKDGVPLWLGLSLILTAISTLVVSLIPPGWWLTATAPWLADWTIIFRVPALLILNSVYDEASQVLIWLAAGMVLVGILLILLAMIFKRRQPKTL